MSWWRSTGLLKGRAERITGAPAPLGWCRFCCSSVRRTCRGRGRNSIPGRPVSCRCRASRRLRSGILRRATCRGSTNRPRTCALKACLRSRRCRTWHGRPASGGATSITAAAWSTTMPAPCARVCRPWRSRATTLPRWRQKRWRSPTPDREASGSAWAGRSTTASRWRGRCSTVASPCSASSGAPPCWA